MLLTSQRACEIETQPPGTDDVDADTIEALRRILTSQQHREVAYDEAREIGNSLIEFYQALAAEECDGPAA